MNTRNRLLVMMFPLLVAAPAYAVMPLSETLAPVVSAQNATAEPVANNSAAAAQSMIEKLGSTAMSAIKDTAMPEAKKKALFHQILGDNFDMTTIGRFAAGKFWRQATPAQQQQYLRLYENMVINVYTQRFNNYSGQNFEVTGNRVDESGDVVVSSQVTGSGSPVNVDWRVRNKGGASKIIDVMVEGVSMAVTQRNDFAGVIQQGGGNFDALITYLKKGGTSDVDK